MPIEQMIQEAEALAAEMNALLADLLADAREVCFGDPQLGDDIEP